MAKLEKPADGYLQPIASADIGRAQPSTLRFHKYSVCGNNFVLVDEVHGTQLPELEKSAFARMAADLYFGIGCDSILFLQRYSTDLLCSINKHRQYWRNCPTHLDSDIDFVFRIFEPDGTESMCCGNGLLSTAHLLNGHYGLSAVKILTEIPSATPRVREISSEKNGACRVNMGRATAFPERLLAPNIRESKINPLNIVEGLNIAFQVKGMDGSLQSFSLPLQGFLTYTGEPHLVILDSDKALGHEWLRINLAHFVQSAFISVHEVDRKRSQKVTQLDTRTVIKAILDDYKESERESPLSVYSVRLLRQIGLCLNSDNCRLFPEGINVNFVRILDPAAGIIEYRCFERGNKKETLACGTGSIAIAVAAYEFGIVGTDRLRLWPKSSRSRDPKAELRVNRDNGGNWWLEGNPRQLFSAQMTYPLD